MSAISTLCPYCGTKNICSDIDDQDICVACHKEFYIEEGIENFFVSQMVSDATSLQTNRGSTASDAESIIKKADKARREKRFAQAIDFYTSAGEIDESNWKSHFYGAYCNAILAHGSDIRFRLSMLSIELGSVFDSLHKQIEADQANKDCIFGAIVIPVQINIHKLIDELNKKIVDEENAEAVLNMLKRFAAGLVECSGQCKQAESLVESIHSLAVSLNRRYLVDKRIYLAGSSVILDAIEHMVENANVQPEAIEKRESKKQVEASIAKIIAKQKRRNTNEDYYIGVAIMFAIVVILFSISFSLPQIYPLMAVIFSVIVVFLLVKINDARENMLMERIDALLANLNKDLFEPKEIAQMREKYEKELRA